uniref:Reverse transcriptase domain-containing protein n=1 Tax=Tanacetum cinerariifolium TaxID=118510 RepID=A0A6L2J6Y7_TANCI|nr:reverse transcriptase domain-containing protein [Tanacetum cinerariifolium]
MRTRSSPNLIVKSFTISNQRNRRRSKKIVEPELRTIVETPVATMVDTRTMSELLQAPTEGYRDAIVIPTILAEDFELKKFDETFSEAWDRFKDLLRKCSHHGFSELHQIDTFYNALTQFYQDSLNAAAGGNLLNRTPRDALMIIENVESTYFTKQTDCFKTTVKAIEETCVTYGVPHPYYECLVVGGNTFDACAAVGTYNKEVTDTVLKETRIMVLATKWGHPGSLSSNTIANPRGDVKAITTRSGVSYDGPMIPPTSSPLPKEVEREPEATKDKVQTTSSGSTTHVHPLVVQVLIPEPNVAPKPNPKPLHFDLSFADALLHIPKFASMFKSLLSNKEKLFELANTPLTENCLAVLLKKLLKKLRDPGRFLVPCDFHGLESCMALADLGASINLMPLSIWKKLSLPDLTPTRMTLELATRSIAYPARIAEYIFVQVGKFTFLADFIVVDYDVDPHTPLILGRPFLRTAHALVDVHGEELILRDGDEQLIFHADSTSKHPHKHESINMIKFIDITCEDCFLKVLKFKKSNHSLSGSTTPLFDSFPNPSTESDIEIINHILEKFIDKPALDYSPLPGDDDDDDADLFDLKSDNVEWKKLLYGDSYKDIDSEKDKNLDSNVKLLVVEAHIVESNVLLPQSLDSS